MEPARCFRVRTEFAAFPVHLAGKFEVILKVVGINEVLARVVRRIDIYQLDLAGVTLLQQLEHFEIVALDHEILSRVPIDALLRAGAEGAGGRNERDLSGAALAVPVEAVLLLTLIDRTAEKPLEYLEIDLALGEGFGEQRLELLDVRRDDV